MPSTTYAPAVLRTLIAAVLVMAVAGAGALLARSPSGGSGVAVHGTTSSGRRSALVMAGVDGSAAAAAAAEAETTTAPTVVPTTAPATTVAPRTASTLPASARHHPASTTTTVPQIATAGPATGHLAVSVLAPNGARAIATMAADGSGERVLATGDYFDPHWTPDGRFVLFESLDTNASWAVPAAGGPVTPLSDGVGAVVSPDGTTVVSVVATSSGTIPPPLSLQKIAETASGLVAVGPAVPLGVNGVGPVWSPDGRRILFGTEMGGSSGLAIVNADGTGLRDLPVKASGFDRPGFSADGSTISFIGTDSTAYFIGADGQGLRPALPATIPGVPNLGAFVTGWSPDHQTLAVLVNGGQTIAVVDTNGHLVTTAHLAVGAMPMGVAFDGGAGSTPTTWAWLAPTPTRAPACLSRPARWHQRASGFGQHGQLPALGPAPLSRPAPQGLRASGPQAASGTRRAMAATAR